MGQLLGEIRLFPYNFVPALWAPCDGQVLMITKAQTLFAVLGTRYGGDGQSTFALPNLKGKAPDPNMRYCIAMQGEFPSARA
jgi:microcystin-dependent protein